MKGHTRIEVRHSSQHVFNERVHVGNSSRRLEVWAFDLASRVGVHDDIYDGPATVTVADICREARVRLAGYIDPIDGQYHWQGTLFGQFPVHALARVRTRSSAWVRRRSRWQTSKSAPRNSFEPRLRFAARQRG